MNLLKWDQDQPAWVYAFSSNHAELHRGRQGKGGKLDLAKGQVSSGKYDGERVGKGSEGINNNKNEAQILSWEEKEVLRAMEKRKLRFGSYSNT